MVAKDEDLQDTGGALPQWIFEVERAYGYGLTSRVYPIESIESTDALPPTVRPSPFYSFIEATDAAGPSILEGELRATLQGYSTGPEATDADAATIQAGELKKTLTRYEGYPPEAADADAAIILAGELKETLVKYERYPAEATDAAAPSIVGGVF
jgi:hypothetical protein